MKYMFYLIPILTFLLISSCKPSAEDEALKIKNLETSVYDAISASSVDTHSLNELVTLYKAYASSYPQDEKSPDMLMKAGAMKKIKGDIQGALTFYDQVIQQYEDKEQYHARALFQKGFIIENDLGDINKARKVYTEFLEKYPDHELADDVKISIEMLGIDPSLLVEKWKREQAIQDSLDKIQ